MLSGNLTHSNLVWLICKQKTPLFLLNKELDIVMLDYIYMVNLPIYISVFYFVVGFGLNVISYNIAINNFKVKRAPLFVMILMYFVGNIGMVALLSLIGTHVGLYFLVSVVIPYAAVWRTDF